jgi:hypothetical protein
VLLGTCASAGTGPAKTIIAKRVKPAIGWVIVLDILVETLGKYM